MTTTVEVAASSVTEEVAGQVRAELARQRVTSRDLAKITGRSHTFWWRRLTGEVPLDVVDLVAVATILDVPVGTLIAPLDAERSRSANGR